jgi:alpha-tubulin suppressor-like RCC1 family protein
VDQLDVPTGSFVEVTAGGFHSCAIRSDGTLACWGDDFDGRNTPPEGTFLHVAADFDDSCAIRTDGTLVCWGASYYGQDPVPEGLRFTQITAGLIEFCALDQSGREWCWDHHVRQPLD